MERNFSLSWVQSNETKARVRIIFVRSSPREAVRKIFIVFDFFRLARQNAAHHVLDFP